MAKDNNADKPQPPKRPLSAFFLFRKERYDAVVKANPNKGVADITKIISEEWNKLGDDKKKGYTAQYTSSKAGYDKELKEYVDKYGKVEKKKKIKRNKQDKDAKNGKKGAAKKDGKAKKAGKKSE